LIGSTTWCPVTSRPGLRVVQVKFDPFSTFVIRQTAGRSFGCHSRARPPTTSGPASRRSTRFTDAVQSGQPSTSLSTAQTRGGGALMSTVMLNVFIEREHS